MKSDRSEALASHHFLAEYSLQCAVAKTTSQKPVTFDRSALQHPLTRRWFTQCFEEELTRLHSGRCDDTVQGRSSAVNNAFLLASKRTLPTTLAQPRRPWIRSCTLGLIDERSQARRNGTFQLEKQLNVAITRSAKRDKDAWLNDLARS